MLEKIYNNFRNCLANSRPEEWVNLRIHFFTIMTFKLELLFDITTQLPYKLSKYVCICTVINPAHFSKNETQMITIWQPKMPSPYGKCKCFQSGTCSVRSSHGCFDWIALVSEQSAKRKHLHHKKCREAARLRQRKERSVDADKLPVILRSTGQCMIDASVGSMPHNNFCTPGRTSCPWNSIENCTPDNK